MMAACNCNLLSLLFLVQFLVNFMLLQDIVLTMRFRPTMNLHVYQNIFMLKIFYFTSFYSLHLLLINVYKLSTFYVSSVSQYCLQSTVGLTLIINSTFNFPFVIKLIMYQPALLLSLIHIQMCIRDSVYTASSTLGAFQRTFHQNCYANV